MKWSKIEYYVASVLTVALFAKFTFDEQLNSNGTILQTT